jgi:two-component system, chemotaxis family, chemotaxis protein CheY
MPTILIVDDSETVREQVRTALSAAGFQIAEASDGLQGLEEVQRHSDIKLIICDVNMPKMDGLTMCKRLQALPGSSKPPVFMLTTEADPDLKTQGKAAGVVAWITKPFSPDKLVAAVTKILSR